jgi:hypothetical protein
MDKKLRECNSTIIFKEVASKFGFLYEPESNLIYERVVYCTGDPNNEDVDNDKITLWYVEEDKEYYLRYLINGKSQRIYNTPMYKDSDKCYIVSDYTVDKLCKTIAKCLKKIKMNNMNIKLHKMSEDFTND